MKYEHQLRKLSSEERKNLSSEEIFHSAEFSSYLQKMGETLLRHCGITKRLSLTILPTGIAPGWTDGKKEYLVPENTITEAYNDIYAKFTALLGIHFHEIAHIIYCDFAEEQKAIDKIKAGEFYGELPVPKTQAEVDALTEMKDALQNSAYRPLFQQIFNDVTNTIDDPHDMMFDPDSLTPEEQPCVGPYMTFKQSSPNLRGNLIVNLAADIGVMDDAKVRTLLSTPCIDMSLPGKQPCAYFCIFPDSHDTYKFIVSLFFSMLFITLINDADNNGKDRKLDVPVDFLLDEFPSIGTIPDFDRKMATIRKRAMNVCMIFQDITQLQNNYQTTWATLLSNCSTLVSLGINDEFTAKMVSSRIGDTTVNVRTNQHKAMETLLKNNEFLHNWSSGEGKRALVGLDEAFKMGKNDSIIIFQGHNPILAKKYPHTLHTDAKKLSNFDFREIPPITDKEGRELFYQRQQNILDTFNITHPHINEVDRSYTGMCNSIPVQSIWEESKDAVIAYVKEINKKGSDDDVIEVEDCGDEYIEVDETDEEQAVEPSAPPAQQEPVLSVDAKPNADIDLESAENETEPQQEDISKPKEVPTPAEAKDVAQGGKRPAPPKRSFSSTPTTGKPRMSGKLPGMR